MSSNRSNWPALLLGVALVAAGITIARRDDREVASASASAGPDPTDSEAVVDEWGEESFPASDPPASY